MGGGRYAFTQLLLLLLHVEYMTAMLASLPTSTCHNLDGQKGAATSQAHVRMPENAKERAKHSERGSERKRKRARECV